MAQVKVGVLRGGASADYDISLQMGGRIIDMLRKEHWNKEYTPIDILIDQGGKWHIGGFEVLPEQALRQVDVVFNALHGEYGGDGRIQHTLETFHKPFTGSKSFATIMARDKKISRETMKKAGIKTPYAKDLHLDIAEPIEPIAKDVFHSFPMPVVVKPRNTNASLGVSIATNFEELTKAIDHARVFSNDIVVEEYISGREIVSGFIDDYRGQDHYDIMPVEVEPHTELKPGDRIKTRMFDYADKLSGNYTHRVPATLSEDEKKTIFEAVRKAKEQFNMRHIGTLDIIVSPKRGVYVLDINTHPHFHDHAPFLKSLNAVGATEEELVMHLIKLALRSK
jgi:D-alanine-D-alanine ligase